MSCERESSDKIAASVASPRGEAEASGSALPGINRLLGQCLPASGLRVLNEHADRCMGREPEHAPECAVQMRSVREACRVSGVGDRSATGELPHGVAQPQPEETPARRNAHGTGEEMRKSARRKRDGRRQIRDGDALFRGQTLDLKSARDAWIGLDARRKARRQDVYNLLDERRCAGCRAAFAPGFRQLRNDRSELPPTEGNDWMARGLLRRQPPRFRTFGLEPAGGDQRRGLVALMELVGRDQRADIGPPRRRRAGSRSRTVPANGIAKLDGVVRVHGGGQARPDVESALASEIEAPCLFGSRARPHGPSLATRFAHGKLLASQFATLGSSSAV